MRHKEYHRIERIGWLRAAVLGANDGIISTASLLIGVAAAHTPSHYPTYLLILSGFFVGIGTKLGSGCTSGHGVCGIARMSPRSFVATGVFLMFGVFTVYFFRHLWSLL